MKKIFLFCFVLIFFFSCKSSQVIIPGYVAEQKKSIFVEFLTIADAYFDLEKYDKAIDYYKMAMSSKALKWESYYKLGRAYAFSKNWSEAKTVYETLLLRDKDNVDLKISLAYIYAMSGELEKAEKYYEELSKQNPDNAEVLSNYINIVLAQENVEKSEELILLLKEKFSDNKNITTFETKLSELKEKSAPQKKEEQILTEDTPSEEKSE